MYPKLEMNSIRNPYDIFGKIIIALDPQNKSLRTRKIETIINNTSFVCTKEFAVTVVKKKSSRFCTFF